MTKRQVIWMLIRLAGLWFLWQSVENAVAIFGSYLHASQDAELLSKSAGLFLQMILQMGFHLALGLYCLGAGNLLFNLLNREKSDDGDSDPGSTQSSTLGLP